MQHRTMLMMMMMAKHWNFPFHLLYTHTSHIEHERIFICMPNVFVFVYSICTFIGAMANFRVETWSKKKVAQKTENEKEMELYIAHRFSYSEKMQYSSAERTTLGCAIDRYRQCKNCEHTHTKKRRKIEMDTQTLNANQAPQLCE